MGFAGRLLQDRRPVFDVVEALANLDKAEALKTFDGCAVNRRGPTLAVVALAVMLSYTLRQ